MRWIFRYNDQAAKYVGRILKKKMPKPEPWMHIVIKTMSNRNPWSGYAIIIWDTRQVLDEYRSSKGLFTTDMFTIAKSGMQRANDNRQPLKGGRKDINEFFEFGDKFDASKGTVFDGKNRLEQTTLYKRRAAKANEAYNNMMTVSPKQALQIGKFKPKSELAKSAQHIVPVDALYRFYEPGNVEHRQPYAVNVTVVAMTDNGWYFTMQGINGYFRANKSSNTVSISMKDVELIADIIQEIDDAEDDKKRIAQASWLRDLDASSPIAEVAQNARDSKKAKQDPLEYLENRAVECDMTSDNTGLAPDIDTVSSGDDQAELGYCYTDGKHRYCIRTIGGSTALFKEGERGPVAVATTDRLIKIYNLRKI